MKRLLYWIVTLLEIVLLAGTYVVNYFTVKKLGMVRWVNARGLRWEKNYPIPFIKGIVIILLLAITILVFLVFKKKRKSLKKITYIMIVGMIALTALGGGYILFCSFKSMRAYYLISIMLACAAFLQVMKTFAGIMVCRNEK